MCLSRDLCWDFGDPVLPLPEGHDKVREHHVARIASEGWRSAVEQHSEDDVTEAKSVESIVTEEWRIGNIVGKGQHAEGVELYVGPVMADHDSPV